MKTRRASTSERGVRVIKSIVHLVLKRWLHCSTRGITCAGGDMSPSAGISAFSLYCVLQPTDGDELGLECEVLHTCIYSQWALTRSPTSRDTGPALVVLRIPGGTSATSTGGLWGWRVVLQDLSIHSAAGAGGRGREGKGRERSASIRVWTRGILGHSCSLFVGDFKAPPWDLGLEGRGGSPRLSERSPPGGWPIPYLMAASSCVLRCWLFILMDIWNRCLSSQMSVRFSHYNEKA